MASTHRHRGNPDSNATGSLLILGAALGLGFLAWRQFGGSLSGQPGGQPMPYPQLPPLINLQQWGGAGFAFDQVARRVYTITEGADAGPANSLQEAMARVNAWFGR